MLLGVRFIFSFSAIMFGAKSFKFDIYLPLFIQIVQAIVYTAYGYNWGVFFRSVSVHIEVVPPSE